MNEVLEQLKLGIRRFQTEVFPEQSEIFARAAREKQQPHTLFITCADSRIDPNAITSSGTGEVFVARNIGNMVPKDPEALSGVSAVIEYAVTALHVRHIVICGHAHCGAVAALLAPGSVEKMPAVGNWLANANASLAVAEAQQECANAGFAARSITDVLTEKNVLLQMQHLKSHPCVAEAMAAGELTISGWVYDFGTGEVRIAEDGQRTFTSIRPEPPASRH